MGSVTCGLGNRWQCHKDRTKSLVTRVRAGPGHPPAQSCLPQCPSCRDLPSLCAANPFPAPPAESHLVPHRVAAHGHNQVHGLPQGTLRPVGQRQRQGWARGPRRRVRLRARVQACGHLRPEGAGGQVAVLRRGPTSPHTSLHSWTHWGRTQMPGQVAEGDTEACLLPGTPARSSPTPGGPLNSDLPLTHLPRPVLVSQQLVISRVFWDQTTQPPGLQAKGDPVRGHLLAGRLSQEPQGSVH